MAHKSKRGRSAPTETTPNYSLCTLEYTGSPNWRQQLDDDIENVERAEFQREVQHDRPIPSPL